MHRKAVVSAATLRSVQGMNLEMTSLLDVGDAVPEGSQRRRPRRILITGAAGAIGGALVAKFRSHGDMVFGIDNLPRPPALDIDAYLQVDLEVFGRETADNRHSLIAAARDWSEEAGLDVLVNNAAVQILGSLETLEYPEWQTTMDVNLLAPFFLTKDLLAPLERAHGCVINISSIHARLTKAGFVAYATSKAALSGLTRAMAVDVGPRVRVNAVEPASIQTAMLDASFAASPEAFSALASRHPQGRIGTPDEVAALTYAIALGGMTFLHGACIDISGGIGAALNDPA